MQIFVPRPACKAKSTHDGDEQVIAEAFESGSGAWLWGPNGKEPCSKYMIGAKVGGLSAKTNQNANPHEVFPGAKSPTYGTPAAII